MKEKLGIEEDIITERAYCKGKIQGNDGTRNRKRTIVAKFLDFKDKPRIQHTYREKKLQKEKNLCKREFFGGHSKHAYALAKESEKSSIAKQGSKGCT